MMNNDVADQKSDAIEDLQVLPLVNPNAQGVFFSPLAPANQSKNIVPAKSIIKVFATQQEANYVEPWMGASPDKCTGSGFVIERDSVHYVVTNAHVVGDSKRIQVKITGQSKKYTAVPLQICYQSDLAVLEVKDPAFQKKSKPVLLGGLVDLQDKVKAMGFPVGGDGLSITVGAVSRVELGVYETGRVKMLQIQVDSAINPGNSGGPVFSGDKVIGVAFQGSDEGEALGYIIPSIILEHHLEEVFSGKKYQGFPHLPIETKNLENLYLREYHKMRPEETGVIINQIDTLSDAHEKLKTDDVLLSIEGFVVSNVGKINYPGIEDEIDFMHLCHMKYVGDDIDLDILRNGERLSISVKLDCVPHATKKLGQDEHDRRPTYYFASGVLFQPLNMNYFLSMLTEEQTLDPMLLYRFPGVGTIQDVPKASPSDQFVFINTVLDCEENEGYENCVKELVKEINGLRINNIHDVVKAIEQNPEPIHMVSLMSGEKMALKNMPEQEHLSLLNHYGIKQDRSEDLIMEKEEEKEIQKVEQAHEKKKHHRKKHR